MNPSYDKNGGTYRSGRRGGVGGGGRLLCDLGSELRLGRREKTSAKKINGMEKNGAYFS